MAARKSRMPHARRAPKRVRVRRVASLLAIAALASGCGSDDGGSDATNGDLGAQVFADNCAGCHGADGQGGTGPKLADGAVVEHYPDIDDQRSVIEEGRGQMPAWGLSLSGEEIDAVVRYTRERL